MSRFFGRTVIWPGHARALVGVAGLLAMGVAAAEAQSRPPTIRPPMGRPGSISGGSGGGGALPAEVQRRSAPRSNQVDIFDMRDRTGSAERRAAPAELDPPEDGGGQKIAGAITCEAGCDGAPGKVVYMVASAAPVPADGMLQQAALVTAPAGVASDAILCMAGCFDEPAWRGGAKRAPVAKDSVVMVALGAPTVLPSQPQRMARVVSAKPIPSHRLPRLATRTAKVAPHAAARITRANVPSARLTTTKFADRRSVASFKRRPVTRAHVRHRIIRPVLPFLPPLPRLVLPPVRYTASVIAREPALHARLAEKTSEKKVAVIESKKPLLPNAPAVQAARKAARDPELRRHLAVASNDWFNKAKRDAMAVHAVR